MSEVAAAFREAHGKAVATLVRVFGDISLAEDAVQDAFVLPRPAPKSPRSRISRSTWQRGTWWPSRLSCCQILRTP